MIRGLGKALLVGTFAIAVTNTAPAVAAADGTFGPTSQGTVGITASVPGRVKISKLSDVTFAPVDLTVDASKAQDVCVWSNTAGRLYTIRASGSGTGGAFTLASTGNTVPYSVQWNQTSGQSTGTPMLAGVNLTGQSSSAVMQDCGAGHSASLIVGIASAELQGMVAAANYTGTLTLLVSPQ